MVKSFFLNKIVYYITGAIAALFVLSFWIPSLFRIANLLLLLLGIAILLDSLLLYGRKKGMSAERLTTDRFSIGDENKVSLVLANHYAWPVQVSVIDEIPIQFQDRQWL